MSHLALVVDPADARHIPTGKVVGRSRFAGCSCQPGIWTSTRLPVLHAGQDPDERAGTIEPTRRQSK